MTIRRSKGTPRPGLLPVTGPVRALLVGGTVLIVLLESLPLVMIVLAINLLGDWLRDALNPRLR